MGALDAVFLQIRLFCSPTPSDSAALSVPLPDPTHSCSSVCRNTPLGLSRCHICSLMTTI